MAWCPCQSDDSLYKERWADNQAPTNLSCLVDNELLGQRIAREPVTEACLRDPGWVEPRPVGGLPELSSTRARVPRLRKSGERAKHWYALHLRLSAKGDTRHQERPPDGKNTLSGRQRSRRRTNAGEKQTTPAALTYLPRPHFRSPWPMHKLERHTIIPTDLASSLAPLPTPIPMPTSR